MTGTPLLTATGISVRYGATHILRDIDAVLAEGEELVLLGRSGSGKTTLLLALAGLLPTAAGRVERHGLSRRDVAMVFQSPSLLPELSAVENVALPLRLDGTLSAVDARARAVAALEQLGIEAFDALPGQLSGGQQQRVAVARVLAGDPRVVLADEPTGALDPVTGDTVLTALLEHRRRVGGALLIATHDEEIAAKLPGRLLLTDGRLTADAA